MTYVVSRRGTIHVRGKCIRPDQAAQENGAPILVTVEPPEELVGWIGYRACRRCRA